MSNASMLFESIISTGMQGIESLLGREEHDFLDFKRKSRGDVRADKNDKANYSEALAGFSNTSGGLIVWGIVCSRDRTSKVDVASALEPIQNVMAFVNDLNDYLYQAMTPANPGIRNEAVRCLEDESQGFVVTYVPESSGGPHRTFSADKLYPTRIGSAFYEMSHAALSDMFGSRQRPVLSITYKVDRSAFLDGGTHCKVHIGIKNIGRFVAVYPAIVLRASEQPLYASGGVVALPSKHTWSIQQQYAPRMLGRNDLDGSFMWAGGVNDVIHPNTTLPLTSIDRVVDFRIVDAVPSSELRINYELYAQACEPELGQLVLSKADLAKELGVTWPPGS